MECILVIRNRFIFNASRIATKEIIEMITNNDSTYSIAADILIEIIAIKKIAKDVVVNKRQCSRIVSRISSLVPTLHRIREKSAPHSYSEAMLMDILKYFTLLKEFISKFNQDYIKRAWKNYYEDSKVFSNFNQGISDRLGPHRLQFDLLADEKKNLQEDANDRDIDRKELRAKIEPRTKIVKQESPMPTPPPEITHIEEVEIDNATIIGLLKQIRGKRKQFDQQHFPILRNIDMDFLELNTDLNQQLGLHFYNF